MPLDSVTKETTIPLETSRMWKDLLNWSYSFNKNKPRRPMTVSVDCFYVFLKNCSKLQAKEVSSSGNKYALSSWIGLSRFAISCSGISGLLGGFGQMI